MSLITVNITIADRSYRLKLAPEHEEIVRKTAKIINDKITEFKTNFAGKDMQDFVAMVLLWYATEHTQVGEYTIREKEAKQELKILSNILQKALAEQ